MDRTLVYPGGIPLDSDILTVNRNVMVAIGYMARAVLGEAPIVDGLSCTPTSTPTMSVVVGRGSITQLGVVDPLAYGSLGSLAEVPLVKMGINTEPTEFDLVSPTTSGHAINYLVQASFQESDGSSVVLPYYNAANPAQPYSGPTNSGLPQSTSRTQRAQLQLKAGVPATIGSQLTPPVDNGWVGLHIITVSYGQTAITQAHIATFPTAPILEWKLPRLRPGFGSGTSTFNASGSFVVPAGVSQVEVEVWGAGAGSYASVAGGPSGGGAAGGYARKRVTGLTPGQLVAVTIGSGGQAGTVGGAAPTGGGSSSFGAFVSATGGALNYLASAAAPQHGGTPAGTGVGGDVNLVGSAGQAGVNNQGGMGGGAPMGGAQNSGTTGGPGVFPGGGAAGAGTGADGVTLYNGAAGAGGFVVVRW
jgi:hypothetical protein